MQYNFFFSLRMQLFYTQSELFLDSYLNVFYHQFLQRQRKFQCFVQFFFYIYTKLFYYVTNKKSYVYIYIYKNPYLWDLPNHCYIQQNPTTSLHNFHLYIFKWQSNSSTDLSYEHLQSYATNCNPAIISNSINILMCNKRWWFSSVTKYTINLLFIGVSMCTLILFL